MSENPFEVHGIYNVSPSSCNSFVAQPALWVMERVLRKKSPPGAPMHAGTAAEKGIVAGLQNPTASPDFAVEVAMKEWRTLTALCGDPRVAKYNEAIPKMVALGLEHLRPYGAPSHTQGKIEHHVPGLAVPFIGYFDLEWEKDGILTDIKTTMRMPAEVKLAHARQVALYKHAISDNLDGRVTYVTDKKVETYRVDDTHLHLKALEKIAFTMQRFLALSKDPHELAALVLPDYESFYWNDASVRARGLEVWGF